MSEQDFTHATLRERIVEHVFLGDLLRALWNRGDRDIEVLRPEFDTHGYDVVLSCRSIERYLQLKTLSGKTESFLLEILSRQSQTDALFVLALRAKRWS
jgi:hypothetical protein